MRPLVVDLDGTLTPSDLLDESATQFLSHHPSAGFRALGWLMQGRAALKAEVASRSRLDVATLPLRQDVLAWLRDERDSGRRLVLATASDVVLAEAFAARLGLFDEVIASGAGINLKGHTKREALVERFGEGGFDYVGDSAADLQVWRSAATAHVVGAKRDRLERRLEAGTLIGTGFGSTGGGVRDLVRAMRPHQWLKNILVLVPLLTAQRLNVAGSVAEAVLAFAVFCLISSGVYVLNDLVDLASDRQHPSKHRRPFASGRIALRTGWMLWPALIAAGLGLSALFLPLQFLAALIGYIVATVAYSFALKRIPVVDVLTLGLLYTSRIVAGAAAIDVELSLWLLTFSMFFFLSLALVKRVSELSRVRRTMGQVHGRGYVESDLELLSSYGVAASVASIVIFSLYVNEPSTAGLYRTPELLWCSVPLMLGWLMRAWLIAHRGNMDEDPILFALRDRASRVVGIAVVAVFVAAKVIAW